MEAVTYSVAQLGEILRATVEQVFPYDLWVAGEIRNLNRAASGHVYFDLVEPAPRPGAQPDARISVVLFRSTREIVNRQLKAAGGMRIQDGMMVRIRGAVDFYPIQGRLQLRMSGIDPGYTLGALAAEKEQLLRRLAEEGLTGANALRPLALVPSHIALVTRHGSAAAADFLNELRSSGLFWQVSLVDTPVQGAGAEHSIAAAIALAGRTGVDAVALVRGGGARTELACFDAETVARAIAGCPVPVLTGIGHEIDRSIADEVAHTSTKTPTACAAALVAHVRRFVDGMDERWRRVAEAAKTRLAGEEAALDRCARHAVVLTRAASAAPASQLDDRAIAVSRAVERAIGRSEAGTRARAERVAGAARRKLHHAASALATQSAALATRAPRALGHEERRLRAIEAGVRALDPARNLARGWSITTDQQGRVVRSVRGLAPGAMLRTRVADGTIASRIEAVDGGDPAGAAGEGGDGTAEGAG